MIAPPFHALCPPPLLANAMSQSVVDGTVYLGVVVLFVSTALAVWRLLRGPHLADRAISADTVGVNLIGLVILATIHFETLVFFDGVLILALLGFATTVAVAQYIARSARRTRSLPPNHTAKQARTHREHP